MDGAIALVATCNNNVLMIMAQKALKDIVSVTGLVGEGSIK